MNNNNLQNKILNLLKDGIANHSNKKFLQAKKNYEKVLKLDHNNYDALRHLGILNLDQNRLEIAEKFFKKSIKVRPDLPEAYNNMGSIHFRNKKYEQAAEAYNNCLKINPNYLPAINNVATMHNKLGQGEKSIKFAKMAYAAQPDNTLSIRNYAHALVLSGKDFEGIKILKNLTDNNPDSESINLLGNVYRENGDIERGIECYLKVLKLENSNPHAFYHASNSRNVKISDQQISDAENKLSEVDFQDSHEASVLSFGLYNVIEKKKNLKKAFHYLMLGNNIENKILKPDIKNEFDYFKIIKRNITKKIISENKNYGSLSEQPIFIVGMPRSGTTLIEQILSSHSKVFGAGELPFIPHTIVAPSYNHNRIADERYENTENWLNEVNIKRWSDNYLKLTSEISGYDGSQHITDKLPHNFIHLGIIRVLFPNSKIIYCKRDPMDNCLSLLRTPFEQDHYYFYDQKLIAEYYNLHLEFMDYWKNSCGIEMYTLQHETLVEKPEETIRDVLDYCNLKWEKNCLNFHKSKRKVTTASSTQVRQPINKNSIRSWKKYENELALMKEILDHKNVKK